MNLPLIDKLRTDTNLGVTFAPGRGRELLAGRLDELARPEPPEWQTVKHNASRTVYRGRIDGREIYLKHYHPRSIWKRLAGKLGYSQARREMTFSLLLSAGGVDCVQALAAGRSGRTEWLATAAVAPAAQADQWHRRNLDRGPAGRKDIHMAIVALARTIAAMHAAGLVHGDLHAGNIMIRTDGTGPRCVLMDLHRMSTRRRMSRRARAANLAQLMSDRYDCTTRTERLLFLTHYIAAGQLSGTLRGWQRIIDQFAARHRRKLYAKRDRRTVGNNRYFSRIALPNGWSGHVVLAGKRRTRSAKTAELQFELPDWTAALARPDLLIDTDITQVVKDSASGTVVRRKVYVGPHELDVFVKRRRRKRRWKVLLDCFRPARSIAAFRMGHSLLTRRIATVRPLAALQRRVGPFLLDDILITEAHDARHLDQFLNDRLACVDKAESSADTAQRWYLAQQLLWQMGRLLQKLHESNFRHRDLKCPNMLVQWLPDSGPELLLVDMDGLRRVHWLTMRQRYQNLMRLNVSLLRCPAVSHAGQLRMLLGYLRRTGYGKIQFKPYWRMLEEWSAKKLHQQIRSRRRKQKAVRR